MVGTNSRRPEGRCQQRMLDTLTGVGFTKWSGMTGLITSAERHHMFPLDEFEVRPKGELWRIKSLLLSSFDINNVKILR